MQRIRAVVDTAIWVKAFLLPLLGRSGMPYAAVLDALFDDKFIPVYSSPMMVELNRVLKGKIKRENPGVFTDPEVDDFVLMLREVGEFIEIEGDLDVCNDKDDNCFIETAVEARVEYLVAEDQHFRFHKAVRFLKANDVQLVYPKQFLKVLPPDAPNGDETAA